MENCPIGLPTPGLWDVLGAKGISRQLSRNAHWEFVEVHFPKLDAVDSNPISGSIVSNHLGTIGRTEASI